MDTAPVLICFVGSHDPGPLDVPGSDGPGPVLSLLGERTFSTVCLLATGDAYLERALAVAQGAKTWCPARGKPVPAFRFFSLPVRDVIDYRELYGSLKRQVADIREELDPRASLAILLDPGTPQMQTAWFLLVAAGQVEAELIQGLPPRVNFGRYQARTVNPRSIGLPHIVDPAGAAGDDTAKTDTGSGDEDLVNSENRKMADLLASLRRSADYPHTLVFLGPSGTGKSTLAHAVHRWSPRRSRSFLSINCANISPELADSELFGHEKGAFTGATTRREGAFIAADGGTLFLDEVATLPLAVQAKLLTVLDTGLVPLLGSTRKVKVDVRVIAATNADLEAEIAAGRFRDDLYWRLAKEVYPIPALRDRPEDIPVFAAWFLERWSRANQRKRTMDPDVVDLLARQPWPGNLRDLDRVLSRAAVHCARPPVITVEDIQTALGVGGGNGAGPRVAPPRPSPAPVPAEVTPQVHPRGGDLPTDADAWLRDQEVDLYRRALDQAEGNAEKAAALLGIRGHTFRKRLDILGIRERKRV